MNLTIDQFIAGLENSIDNFPNLIKDWEYIDYDLQCEYSDNISWLLNNQQLLLDKAKKESRLFETIGKLNNAKLKLIPFYNFIENVMCVTLHKDWLPGTPTCGPMCVCVG